MPVTSSDIYTLCSANMPENNSSVSGGVISETKKAIFTDISATGTLEMYSSDAGDTNAVVVTGRTAAGVITTENFTIAGAAVLVGSVSFERILKIVVTGTHAGTITVRKGSDDVTIATLEGTNVQPTAILEARRLFYDAAAEAAGGATRQFYEKIFIRNNNAAALALTNATITESSDPSTFVTFALASGFNDNTVATGRLNTIPTGSPFNIASGSFSSSVKIPTGGVLYSGSGIGVWLRLELTGGTPPAKNTYTLTVNGTST